MRAPMTTEDLLHRGPAGWTVYGWLYGFAPKTLFLDLLRWER